MRSRAIAGSRRGLISSGKCPTSSQRFAPWALARFGELVAAELGYASQTAFTAAFKKLTGNTPSDWRRRIR